MKIDILSIIESALVVGTLAVVGCSSSSSSSPGSEAGCPATGKDAGCPSAEAGCPGQAGCPAADAGCPSKEAGCPASSTPGDAQTPATGTAAEIDAWIAKGDYKAWHCETAPHASRSPSPHGPNRICSNDLSNAHGTGEYPTGAASVKELYDTGSTKIIGYAMARKMSAGAGDSWYWYETNGSVVANGLGKSGSDADFCVGCHSKAGSDAMHSGHDFVYTQVK